MAALRRKRGPMHEINVVPYIDVMLVLLVIFMVTAPLITPSVIDLPTVGKASAPRVVPLEVFVRADQGLVVRTRDGNGRIIDEAQVSRADLAKVLKNARGANEELSVLVGGDKDARYEAVLQVMDELRKQGEQRVGLQVKLSQCARPPLRIAGASPRSARRSRFPRSPMWSSSRCYSSVCASRARRPPPWRWSCGSRRPPRHRRRWWRSRSRRRLRPRW